MTQSTQQRHQRESLKAMLRIRAYEHQLVAINQASGAAGTCTSVGQEACAVGVVRALDARDRILTNHRSAGHLLARGADPRRMMAEVMGRADGYCKGKSGSLHMSVKELGVVLTSTIVGGELSMVTGVALAQKMGRGAQGGIAATFFGDGAACEGIFHESLNLAVTWSLPILYVCENNQWQAQVPRSQTMPGQYIQQWARSHGIESAMVDGNDVTAVHLAARHAVGRIRETGQPQFLELMTYRLRGHFEPDEQTYVDRKELERWNARDPIAAFATRLLGSGVINPEDLNGMRERATQEMANAAAFAQASPWPDVSELHRDVYA
jgi:acetoin:2,6-dichlorophenolindophenol oxidoreductase subunit alpha